MVNEIQSLGVIAGTGFSDWLQTESDAEDQSSKRLTTAFGEPAAEYHCGRIKSCEIVYLARHGNPHRYAPHAVNYRANIDGFRQQIKAASAERRRAVTDKPDFDSILSTALAQILDVDGPFLSTAINKRK